jgi:catechol 2,3-dioxygenase-like lactoylglutathione lyase family enzyme
MLDDDLVSVRYMVDDVEESVGPKSSAGRPMPDGCQPEPGGWNRIHFIVDDIAAEVERLRTAGLSFRNEIVSGPGGQQILVDDPSGNPIELFQPAG